MRDVLVVGGGPAGLNAALTLGRARRRVSLVDAGAGRNAMAGAVRNFLTREGVSPAELRALGRAELARYPNVEVSDGSIAKIDGRRGDFVAHLAGGGAIRSRRILLATGISDQLPAIDGLADLWGSAVLHCPYCHGWEVRDDALAVLMLNEVDVHFAASLSRWSKDIVAFADPSARLAEDNIELLETLGVQIRRQAIRRVAPSPGTRVEIHVDTSAPLLRRALFVHPAIVQSSDLPCQLGCRAFDDNYIEIDDCGQTSVAGVFAAGDMSRRATQSAPPTFALNAAAQGVATAVFCDQELFVAEPFA